MTRKAEKQRESVTVDRLGILAYTGSCTQLGRSPMGSIAPVQGKHKTFPNSLSAQASKPPSPPQPQGTENASSSLEKPRNPKPPNPQAIATSFTWGGGGGLDLYGLASKILDLTPTKTPTIMSLLQSRHFLNWTGTKSGGRDALWLRQLTSPLEAVQKASSAFVEDHSLWAGGLNCYFAYS